MRDSKTATPEKRVVHAYPFEIDTSDTRPIWQCHERSETTTIVSAFGDAVFGGEALQPHFCDGDYGRDKKAEAIARAVKSAILRGEIDASAFE